MIALEILTEKGQESVKHEEDVIAALSKIHPSIQYVPTHKHLAASIDGILVKNGTVYGLYEVKIRYMTYEPEFHTKLRDRLMVPMDQLKKAAAISHSMMVPHYVILGFTKDDPILMWQVTDEDGNFLFNLNDRTVIKSKSINGGKASVHVGYLPSHHAIKYNRK